MRLSSLSCCWRVRAFPCLARRFLSALVCASVYAGTQHGLDIRVIIGAAASGAILGDNVGFWIGRRFGRTLLMKYGHCVGVDRQKLALGEYLFMRFGGMIVFFGRFVALLRVYAALLAGINCLRPVKFALYNAAGVSSGQRRSGSEATFSVRTCSISSVRSDGSL
jgi:membrane protein DedA with SNARE-associated domain